MMHNGDKNKEQEQKKQQKHVYNQILILLVGFIEPNSIAENMTVCFFF